VHDVFVRVLWVFDAIVVVYFLTYAFVNLGLLLISFLSVKRSLQGAQLEELGGRDPDPAFCPLISLLVPAYNEEVTIVESVRSLLRLDYPGYEIIIVNDGSKDNTVKVLKEAYGFVRNDVDYQDHLGAAKVRGFYRSTVELPKSVVRLVLVDKENGGKADALNAGINASQGAYVASMDADSLMVPRTLHLAVQPVLDDPNRIVAVGGQIALSNNCLVSDGRVTEVRLPKTWIARFQVVEYMRSFTQARTGLAEIDSLLILSGVFALFRRDVLISCGGFLTKHQRSRVCHEYCGPHAETVCEDMEVVVRLQRYLMERGERPRVVFVPAPTSWTEAPEIYESLGKQRSRWYRGLWEVLALHKKMMFNPKFGRVGLFSLPYQLFYEALAPILEILGYLVLPLSWALGVLSLKALLAFGAIAMSFNLLLSTGSVLLAIARIRFRKHDPGAALMDYRGIKDTLILVLAGLLSNIGYRQFIVFWQIKGLKDLIKGNKSWDKFARAGFVQAKS
jgi:cellulose synthase/poly-beta-1,6-N-acetylglucosamine synthase-like glycosyltransferase